MIWNSIKQKLTSRKLWAAVVSFVTAILVYRGSDAGTAESMGAMIWAAASMIAYIFGEGLVDASAASAAGKSDAEKPK